MNYRVFILPRAGRTLTSLPDKLAEKIDAAILGLAQDPRPPGCKKLKEETMYRIRVGDYRVLYTIEDTRRIVLVAEIGHRREVYR